MAKKATPKRTPRKSVSTKRPAAPGANPFDSAMGDLDSAWNEGRGKEQRTQASFVNENVPDGDYTVQLTSAKAGVYRTGKRKGTPYVRFRYCIVLGEFTGQEVSATEDLSAQLVGSSGKRKIDLFFERLQRMGIETKKLEKSQVPQLCNWLTDPKQNTDAKPYFSSAVKNQIYSAEESTTGEEAHFQNIYINEPLDRSQVVSLIKAQK